MTRFLMTIVLALGLTYAVPAAAQVCGDADGNGTVSVSDGVQTLRAAAGLSSTCTDAVCDVDGSGAVTVTDGVSVLRKAAGLPITENCGGALASQPETVLHEIDTLFKIGLAYATSTPVASCANGADGAIDVTTDTDGTTTSFDTCQVDDVELFGDIILGATTLSFCVFEADTVGEEDFISDYDGDLTLGNAGGGRSLNGVLDVTTDSASALTVTVNGVVVVDGKLTSGSVDVDLTDSDIADAFTRLVLMFDGSGVANVVATQANGGTENHRLDLATGNLVS